MICENICILILNILNILIESMQDSLIRFKHTPQIQVIQAQAKAEAIANAN